MIVDLLSSAVICKFINQQNNNVKSCTIAYGPGETCSNLSNHGLSSRTTVTPDSVVINLPELSQTDGILYCYLVTASNDSFTAVVEGMFSTGTCMHIYNVILYIVVNSYTTFYTVCNPAALGSIMLLPTDARCNPPLYTLGISNGIVCYSGTEIGSIAFYSCIDCGFNSLTKGSSVRICTKDGNWDGTITQCNCSKLYPDIYYL